MPFCQNCGRKLAEGEICSCTQNASPYITPLGGMPAQNPSPFPSSEQSQNPQGQPYPYQNPQGQPYQYQYPQNAQQQPQKKSHIGCLIAALVCISVSIGALAAILVPATLGYVKKAHNASANSAAKSVYQSASSALADLDEEGKKVSGTYILSNFRNDSNAPFDTKAFAEKFSAYYTESDTISYFVVVKNGTCTYAAVKLDSFDDLGTYPYTSAVNEVTLYDGESVTDYTIDEVYADAYDEVYSD